MTTDATRPTVENCEGEEHDQNVCDLITANKHVYFILPQGSWCRLLEAKVIGINYYI